MIHVDHFWVYLYASFLQLESIISQKSITTMFLPLCSLEEKKSYRFRTTWRWENGFNFGWSTLLTPPLIQCRIPHIGMVSADTDPQCFLLPGSWGEAGAKQKQGSLEHLLCGSRYGDKNDGRRMICASVLSRDRLWKSSGDKRLGGR